MPSATLAFSALIEQKLDNTNDDDDDDDDDVQDVSKAVLFSRRHSLPLSVRSGGHSYLCSSLKVPSHLNT